MNSRGRKKVQLREKTLIPRVNLFSPTCNSSLVGLGEIPVFIQFPSPVQDHRCSQNLPTFPRTANPVWFARAWYYTRLLFCYNAIVLWFWIKTILVANIFFFLKFILTVLNSKFWEVFFYQTHFIMTKNF